MTKLAAHPSAPSTAGVWPLQRLQRMLADGQLKVGAPLLPEQIQPASLDLRLGSIAWRVQGSFLPKAGNTVRERLEDMILYTIDLTKPAVLEKGALYVIPLMESLALPPTTTGRCSPKSSTGRLDIFCRLITDGGSKPALYDQIPAGYSGQLYLEVAPLTFSVVVRQGDRLAQARFFEGTPTLAPVENAPPVQWLSVNLKDATDGIIGYRARRHTPLIDLSKIGHYAVHEFWEAIPVPSRGQLILTPEDFYIFAARESVSVPATQAAELTAYDTALGEIRIHYAGFFDPGFGTTNPNTKAVLEVRAHDVPALLEDNQPIGRLVYEHLTEPAAQLYGAAGHSNYQGQGLRLAKQFRQ